MKDLLTHTASVSAAAAGLLVAAVVSAGPSLAGQNTMSEQRMAQGCLENRPDFGARSDHRPDCPTDSKRMKHSGQQDKQDK